MSVEVQNNFKVIRQRPEFENRFHSQNLALGLEEQTTLNPERRIVICGVSLGPFPTIHQWNNSDRTCIVERADGIDPDTGEFRTVTSMMPIGSSERTLISTGRLTPGEANVYIYEIELKYDIRPNYGRRSKYPHPLKSWLLYARELLERLREDQTSSW